MPYRGDPRNIEGFLANLNDRVDLLERHQHTDLVGSSTSSEAVTQTRLAAYFWESAETLSVSTGIKFFVERDGKITFVRADRPSGDGTDTATLDVLRNGASIFGDTTTLAIAAGESLSREAVPTVTDIRKDQTLEVQIIDTGGGTGPLRVLIQFEY